jgi:hypothetical protein
MALDPDKVYAELMSAGDDWADKEAAASALEETKKTVLAELKVQHASSSDAAKETAALADPVYKTHIERMVEARRTANRAKVRYDVGKVLAELRRSQESTRRAEMTLR